MRNEKVWVSDTLTIPSTRTLGRSCKFSIFKSFLSRNIAFYLMARDESLPSSTPLPNTVVGGTAISDQELKAILYGKEDEGQIPLLWLQNTRLFRSFEDVRGMLKLSLRLKDGAFFDEAEGMPGARKGDRESRFFDEEHDKTVSNSMNEGIDLYASLVRRNVEVLKIIEEDGVQWRALQEELTRKQKDIQTFFKELDTKSQSLKLVAAEVISLKRKIRNIRRENVDLDRQVKDSATLEPEVILNRPELMSLDDEEVRNRILAIAKAYRDERVRNKTLMKTLKMAQKDIAGRTKVLATNQRIEEAIAEVSAKIGTISHEFTKIGSYKETINKQESMILRLENILKTMAKESKDIRVDYERYSKQSEENARLRANIENFRNPDKSDEAMALRSEIRKVESQIRKLQDEVLSQRPKSAYRQEDVAWRVDKEVELEKFNARADALERQLYTNDTNHAQEVTKYKTRLAEKEAILKSINQEFDP